ncbi:MAG: hypothetical protein KDB14_24260 [Planctomycetales bacterium]|nr:hypothetical protein [Planctomycetales bacterium]
MAAEPARIESRRELFVDDALIDSLDGVTRKLHHPTPREIAIVHDAAWEGAGSGYHSVIRDGDLYRMYYRGSKLGVKDGELQVGSQVYCYAESRDGRTFTKPSLGLFEHGGSKDNNIILTGVGTHNFAPFLDNNPDCPPESRYKALGGVASEGGLFAFHSPDGVRWSLLRKEPVVTEGAFDSQNLAFWDPTAGVYRAYFRTFTQGVTTSKVWKPAGFRAIRTATSRDFLHWENAADLTYEDSPVEHLYTNQVAPYVRAPHLLIGFPTRYIERGWSPSMRALPDPQLREQRAAAHLRYGTSLTEGLLMASRDGVHFQRWNEAFLRPGPERPETWLYGHQYIAWHAVVTPSALPGASDELSLYASEGSWHGNGNAIRRYTLRLDGFVSLSAGWGKRVAPAESAKSAKSDESAESDASPQSVYRPGRAITKPLIFRGDRLSLNFATSAAGAIRIEIQSPDGTPFAGFSLDECAEVYGDSTNREVSWSGKKSLGDLAGKPVRLLIEMRDADLYSFQFRDAT